MNQHQGVCPAPCIWWAERKGLKFKPELNLNWRFANDLGKGKVSHNFWPVQSWISGKIRNNQPPDLSLAWHMEVSILYSISCAALQELACRNKHVPYGREWDLLCHSYLEYHSLLCHSYLVTYRSELQPGTGPTSPWTLCPAGAVQVGTLTYATIQFLGSAILVYLTCFIVARWALHKSITGQGSISIVGV